MHTEKLFGFSQSQGIYQAYLYSPAWTQVAETDFNLQMTAKVWLDEAQTKIWLVSGRAASEGKRKMGKGLAKTQNRMSTSLFAEGTGKSYFLENDVLKPGPDVPYVTMDPAVVRYSPEDFMVIGGETTDSAVFGLTVLIDYIKDATLGRQGGGVHRGFTVEGGS